MVYTSEYILSRQAFSVPKKRFDSHDKTVTEYTIITKCPTINTERHQVKHTQT